MYAGENMDFSSRIELMAGEPQAAEEKLRADYDALTAMDEQYFLPNIAALLAKTLYELERLDEAEELVAVADGLSDPEDVEAQALLQTVQARLLAARGHPEEAKTGRGPRSSRRADRSADLARGRALRRLIGASVRRRADGSARGGRWLYAQKQHLVGLARVEAELAKAPAPALV